MKIALDFDSTFTLNPVLWTNFIDDVLMSGGMVHIVTVRHPYWDAHPLLTALMDDNIPVVFTDGKAKRPYCQNLGIDIDVWIDDRPQTIDADSSWDPSHPDLLQWRKDNYVKLVDDGYTEYARDLSKYKAA